MKMVFTLAVLFLSLAVRGQDEVAQQQLLTDLQILSSDEMEGRETGTAGNRRARDYIIGRYRELGLDSLETAYSRVFPVTSRGRTVPAGGVNLVGLKRGLSPATIVVSAHYDHLGVKGRNIYNGSDDNASGVSAMLFMARQLMELDTRHSIMFIAFDAEEMGLLGARDFVKNLSETEDKVRININLDMVSRSISRELFASGTHHYPFLKPVLSAFMEGEGFNLQLGHDDPGDPDHDWTYSSDHAPFHRKGIPYVYFGVEDHEDYHQPTDTFEKVDREFFIWVAQTLSEFILKLDEIDWEKIKTK